MNPSRKTPLYSPRIIRRKRKRRIILFFLFIFFVSIVVVSLYFASRAESFAIKAIKIEGAETLDTNEISASTEEALLGSYWFLIGKRNIFTYPKNFIKAKLLKDYPRIKNLKISIESKDLKIVITERDPAGVWCSLSSCFFFDREGFLYGTSPEFSGSVYTIYRGGEIKDVELEIGQKFLNQKLLEEIDSFKKLLAESDFIVTEVFVDTLTEISLSLAKNPKIIIDLTTSAEEQLSSLSSILFDESLSKKFNIKDTSYVDLRFGKKVFFKDKSTDLMQPEPESEKEPKSEPKPEIQ